MQFAVTQGGGSLSVAAPVLTTAPDGIAECRWTLGTAGVQEATAVLLDAGGAAIPGQLLRFSANLSVASQVAYNPAKCSNLADAETVQDAIDILCQTKGGGCCVCVGKGGDYDRLNEALADLLAKGERDICICLLHGDQELKEMVIEQKPGEPDLHIKITGCGPGSRVILVEQPIRFINVKSVILSDLAIDIAVMVEVDGGALTFEHCSRVELRGCQIAGFVVAGALVAVTQADHVLLSDNLFEALLPDSFSPTLKIFQAVAQETGVDAPVRLFSLPDQGVLLHAAFRKIAMDVAQQLAALNLDARKKVQIALQKASGTPEQRALQSQGESISYAKLQLLLGTEVLGRTAALDLLLDIRRTAAKTRPGTAIILERPRRIADILPIIDVLDQDDLYLLENNEIAGVLSLYGPPADIAFIDELLNVDMLSRLSSWLKERVRFTSNFLGTLQLRGQSARPCDSQPRDDRGAAQGGRDATNLLVFPLDLFGRCQWGDNVFEGGRSFLVCRHLTLHANEFTQTAQPQGATVPVPGALPAVAGTLVADSTIYVANHGSGNLTLRNLSRLMDQAVNQDSRSARTAVK